MRLARQIFTDDRLMLLAALSGLRPTQRAVVVLRFWETTRRGTRLCPTTDKEWRVHLAFAAKARGLLPTIKALNPKLRR